MKHGFLIVSAALSLAACGSGDQDGDAEANRAAGNNVIETETLPGNEAVAAQTAPSGQQYVDLAGASDQFEIETARLAVEKARRAEIRDFARMILTDHERSTRELISAAGQAQPRLNAAAQLNMDQQARLLMLQRASEAAFDQLYLDQQVEAHEQALSLVIDYAQNGDVPSLRRHAGQVSAPIQQHLSRARQLQTAQ